jgi:hypothetical protein
MVSTWFAKTESPRDSTLASKCTAQTLTGKPCLEAHGMGSVRNVCSLCNGSDRAVKIRWTVNRTNYLTQTAILWVAAGKILRRIDPVR